jgi:sec-independent protein translocase protein TatA
MIGDILQPTHLLFVLVIALLVLGPKRLPEVARQLGKGLRDFRDAISGEDRHDDEPSPEALHEPEEPPFEAPPPSPPVPAEDQHADQQIPGDAQPPVHQQPPGDAHPPVHEQPPGNAQPPVHQQPPGHVQPPGREHTPAHEPTPAHEQASGHEQTGSHEHELAPEHASPVVDGDNARTMSHPAAPTDKPA